MREESAPVRVAAGSLRRARASRVLLFMFLMFRVVTNNERHWATLGDLRGLDVLKQSLGLWVDHQGG